MSAQLTAQVDAGVAVEVGVAAIMSGAIGPLHSSTPVRATPPPVPSRTQSVLTVEPGVRHRHVHPPVLVEARRWRCRRVPVGRVVGGGGERAVALVHAQRDRVRKAIHVGEVREAVAREVAPSATAYGSLVRRVEHGRTRTRRRARRVLRPTDARPACRRPRRGGTSWFRIRERHAHGAAAECVRAGRRRMGAAACAQENGEPGPVVVTTTSRRPSPSRSAAAT